MNEHYRLKGLFDMNETYTMRVDLNVLEHLGLNLYSSIPAVLTEIVANAWDADASRVTIDLDMEKQVIVISDDGCGMTVSDINDKFLYVGYRRRTAEKTSKTPKGRDIMGRKGLGKLSLFSIADDVEVQSSREGERHGFTMSTVDIKETIERQGEYHPQPLNTSDLSIEKGTRITLRTLKKSIQKQSAQTLRKKLARRFSIIGPAHGFEVIVDGETISVADRGDLSAVQFLWYFGDEEPEVPRANAILEKISLPDRLEGWDDSWHVSGWLGTVRKPKKLSSDDEGNLNGIVVLARGRLVQENILPALNDGRLYTKYLAGQIEAGFLDSDDEQDIATSDRQRIQEDDPRYEALLKFVKESLKSVESRWNELRRKHEVEKVKEECPALAEWLDRFAEGHRKSAEEFLAKLGSLTVENEDDRKLLYQHGILAFERMRLRGSEKELLEGTMDVGKLLVLLADRDSLEASMYGDIVKNRLAVIRGLQGLTEADQKEKTLQKYLFNHLWLLDPSWERVDNTEKMETSFSNAMQELEKEADFKDVDKLGRVDIAYRTTAGKHLIIELKRAGRKMELGDLQKQGWRYVDKVKKILAARGELSPDVEVIFVIGEALKEETNNPDRLKSAMESISPGSRVTHYDALIHNAQKAYQDYLAKDEQLAEFDRIIEQISIAN